jgi:hypothetical protein
MKLPIEFTESHPIEIPINNTAPAFGPVVYAYTRKQAVADGEQIDVTETAQKVGIRYPMFITRAVFENFVAVPEGVTSHDEALRLFNAVWMTRIAILRNRRGMDRIRVVLHVHNGQRRATRVQLVAVCSAFDIDDPRPAITLMEHED